MKLRINGFENEIIFNDESISVLQISDSKCFAHIIEIINQKIMGLENNEIFLLNEEEQEINMSKYMHMVFDLFNIEYNSKKIINKLYEMIAKNIQNSQELTIDRLTLELRNNLISEINELPFEFQMKSDINVVDLLKIFDLKIDSTSYTSVLERVEILIDLISLLKIENILVIPNLKTFLSEEELVELYKYSLYNNVKLLVIEKGDYTKLTYEQILYIDNKFNDDII